MSCSLSASRSSTPRRSTSICVSTSPASASGDIPARWPRRPAAVLGCQRRARFPPSPLSPT
jgi:hypothetical protein